LRRTRRIPPEAQPGYLMGIRLERYIVEGLRSLAAAARDGQRCTVHFPTTSGSGFFDQGTIELSISLRQSRPTRLPDDCSGGIWLICSCVRE
jgi:hypothetical protein